MILHRKQYNFANLLRKVLFLYFVSVVAINASILISTSPKKINFACQNGNETCSLHNFRCIYRWLLRHYFLFLFLSVRFVVVGLFAFGKLWPSVIMLNERIADSATHKMTDCCFLHFFFLCFSWIKFGYTISITDLEPMHCAIILHPLRHSTSTTYMCLARCSHAADKLRLICWCINIGAFVRRAIRGNHRDYSMFYRHK